MFAFIGMRHALVDIWLGFVERLFVPVKPAAPSITRRRAAVPANARPVSWQEALYRGSAGTASGTHDDTDLRPAHVFASAGASTVEEINELDHAVRDDTGPTRFPARTLTKLPERATAR